MVKVLKKLIVYSLMLTGLYYANHKLQTLTKTDCTVERKLSKKNLETLIAKIKTPSEAFALTSLKIKFVNGNDTVNGCLQKNVWLSAIDSYSFGKGDCMEGAISFSALYNKSKIVWLRNDNEGHAIAVFENNGKYGIASFNNVFKNKRGSQFIKAMFNSVEDAVKWYSKNKYSSYAIVPFNEQDLKFGTGLRSKYVPEKLKWNEL